MPRKEYGSHEALRLIDPPAATQDRSQSLWTICMTESAPSTTAVVETSDEPTNQLSQDREAHPWEPSACSSKTRKAVTEVVVPLLCGSLTTLSESTIFCRICHTAGEETLLSPCHCTGSLKYVHNSCLSTWFKKTLRKDCELCSHGLTFGKRLKPLMKWRMPEERATCLVWLLVFFVGLLLNVMSVVVNASDRCRTTLCIVFYSVNGCGILLDGAFFLFWLRRFYVYCRKWCALNQEWTVVVMESPHAVA